MRKTILTVAATLTIGAGLGYGASMLGQAPETGAPAQNDEKEVLYWIAPMDPNYRRDEPGKSPMGMELIPIYAGDEAGGDDPNALKISGAVVNNIGVRTDVALASDLSREVNTVGFVTFDEDKTSHVHVRTSGWVEKLYRKAVGEVVQKGEVIFELYSQELVNAQIEFLQSVRLDQKGFASAAQERLKALGMTERQIATIRKSGEVKQRIEVLAPQDGVIIALEIGEGMHVTPGKTVFSLADLSSVWIKVDVFEGQSDWVSEGQQATMTLPFLPGETWEGVVDYVYPIVDPMSRTVQARLAFSNPDGRLKPNMYGEISIAASPVKDVVSIPREALIRTGKTDRVVLALGDGKYRPAEVVAGMESGDRVEIKAGLSAGEVIVTSGQFLIDSEASINSAFLRMLEAGAKQDHAGHDMAEMADEIEVHHGMGTVNSVSDDGTVNLTHDPISSLGWPEMTMDFSADPEVDLSSFAPGDRMHFELTKSADGPFVITKATKM